MSPLIGIPLKFAVAFVLLFGAALISHWLKRYIPEGRVKRLLYKRIS